MQSGETELQYHACICGGVKVTANGLRGSGNEVVEEACFGGGTAMGAVVGARRVVCGGGARVVIGGGGAFREEMQSGETELQYHACICGGVKVTANGLRGSGLSLQSLGHDGVLDHLHFGFGFDPKTDDYKVVKFSLLFRPSSLPQPVDDSCFLDWLPVEVYSRRKGSWKLISDRFPSHVDCILDYDPLLFITGVDGHLHWLCYDGKFTDEVIVAFDSCIQ
ncbi:hypothetical protein L1987_10667 [Smallanthus sonchifolius]|uniref:Uncharacterized protein n=1 Tax=Smallanthus sonchifolius TaxID=185202 RepID=A0ACB9JAA1_9ASTR|nr:hypothetical protein L1987_10667 [Smallanthus sonchifolius]